MNYISKKFPAWIVLLGGVISGIWGILHLSFTESITRQYNYLPSELLESFRMEWVIEGIFLLFIFVLIIALYPHFKRKSKVARKVGFYIGAVLVILAIWHTSGSPLNVLSYRLSTPLFVLSALLIWLPLVFHKGEWS